MLGRRALAGLPLLPAAARAQAEDWPARTIRLVLPYAAGGPTDLIARLLADRLSAILPQRVVVENRTGAGGNIGASTVAHAAGDGHTLLFSNIGHAVNRAIYARLDYDPARDLRPLTILAESPMVLLVPPNAPWRDIAAFIAAVRAAPGRHSYATAGGGGALQLVSLLFLQQAGLMMNEIPYRGSAPAVLDLAAGNLDMIYDAAATALGLARGGQARALMVSGPARSRQAPALPTVAEAGFPGATFSVWQAVFAPGTTPEPLVARINAALVAALADAGVRARLEELGAERVLANTPAEAGAYVAAEMVRWEAVLRASGVAPQ
jgi:tripartite-type tricarboxylate transporter receptor subunit TctC